MQARKGVAAQEPQEAPAVHLFDNDLKGRFRTIPEHWHPIIS